MIIRCLSALAAAMNPWVTYHLLGGPDCGCLGGMVEVASDLWPFGRLARAHPEAFDILQLSSVTQPRRLEFGDRVFL